jgi:alkylation response protein AidB-like acyl-CoA dehydrogenase
MPFFDQYDALLTPRELDLVEHARRFCAGPFSDAIHGAYLRGEPFAREWITRWAAEGMLGLQAKAEHGGHEASFLCKVRVAQEMARHGFAVAFCLNNLQGQATRISHQGSDEQRRHLLKGMLDGTLLAAPSMSEPTGGSDLGSLATTATRVEGGWSISGVKSWITNGTIVDGLTVLARVGEGGELATFVVLCGAEDSVTRDEIALPGARSFRLAKLEFRDHFVPDWALLSKPGEALRTSMAAVNAARVHVAAMAVASLHAALCEATRYCASRVAFGKPLLAHQGLQWELAEVAIRLEAANALVFKAAHLVNERMPALTAAAQCKKFAVDTAIWGIDQCIRATGAIGASGAHRMGMQLAEVRLAAFGDGTNEMMLDRIGRNLAKDYADPVGPETRGCSGR